MFERFHQKSVMATGAALLAALGVGGVAMGASHSSAQSTPPPKAQSAPPAGEIPGQESNAPENSAADPDNVQQGDTGSTAGTAQAGTDQPESPNDQTDAGGAPESGAEESGSEQVNDDGPGGHADEPGNPSADHQAQGVE